MVLSQWWGQGLGIKLYININSPRAKPAKLQKKYGLPIDIDDPPLVLNLAIESLHLSPTLCDLNQMAEYITC